MNVTEGTVNRDWLASPEMTQLQGFGGLGFRV